MNKRPKSITAIAWFYIIGPIITIISVVLTKDNPVVLELMGENNFIPIYLQFFLMISIASVNGISGIGLLKGKNWARYLIVGVAILGNTVNMLTSPFHIAALPGIILTAVFLVLLFYPEKHNQFFKKNNLTNL